MGKAKATRASLQAARAAEAEAVAHRETPAQKRQRIAELEERARLFGDSAKQSAQAKVLERKWLRFLLVHGEEYDFGAKRGPTIKVVEHFTTYCYCTRDSASAVRREGLGDAFELQIRCAPSKFVWCAVRACMCVRARGCVRASVCACGRAGWRAQV